MVELTSPPHYLSRQSSLKVAGVQARFLETSAAASSLVGELPEGGSEPVSRHMSISLADCKVVSPVTDHIRSNSTVHRQAL
jgi:hypothetical protein